MSDSGITDSGRQLDLGSDGGYTPSARASKGASNAQSAGAGSKQVVSDGPDSSNDSFSTPTGSREPKPQSTPKPPAESAQFGSDQLDNAQSVNDRKA